MRGISAFATDGICEELFDAITRGVMIMEKKLRRSLEFAENIINAVRKTLIALDQDLRVVTVSHSFYDFSQVKPEATVGQLLYDVANNQRDVPLAPRRPFNPSCCLAFSILRFPAHIEVKQCPPFFSFLVPCPAH